MNKRLFLFLSLLLSCMFVISTAYADDYSREEVEKKIKSVEQKLDQVKDRNLKHVGREISKIERYIKDSKSKLNDGDEDEAWFEVGKAEAYFILIEAKQRRVKAEARYKAMKKKK